MNPYPPWQPAPVGETPPKCDQPGCGLEMIWDGYEWECPVVWNYDNPEPVPEGD